MNINLTEIGKNVELNLNKFESNRQEVFVNIVGKAVDKGAEYVIKELPVPDSVKDILQDVRESIKTKDVKNVLNTAVKSTIREGLEILGLSQKQIKTLSDLKDISSKGGLVNSIKNVIELVGNNFLKNNIVGDYVYDFFDNLKKFIQSNSFMEKINQLIQKVKDKKDDFLKKVDEWYKCYSEGDVDRLTELASNINRKNDIISIDEECSKENNIVQNVTAMLNNKNEKLTNAQLQLCSVM